VAGLTQVRGSLDEAEAIAAEALDHGQEAGEEDAFTWYSATIAVLRLQQGRLAEIIDLVAEGAAASPELAAWAAFHALALCELGRLDEARGVLDALAAEGFADVPYDLFWLATLCAAGEAAARVGDRAAARTIYDLIAPFAHLPATVTVCSLGSTSRFLGILAATLGDEDAAERHLLDAIADDTRAGSRAWAAAAQIELAELYLRRGRHGDDAQAETLAQDAHAALSGLGAHRLSGRAAALLSSAADH
jgi:tetratricopeptide (TPR) repeat protein